MQKIVPNLWFDKEAREAAQFYTRVFPESEITSQVVLHDTPSGDCDLITFKVWGYELMAISAGPVFKINPAISLMVNFDLAQMTRAEEKLDEVWQKLAEGGKALMELGEYPFSKKYGWIEDKYGVSWQLMLTDPRGEKRPPIVPSLLFVNRVSGQAEEASDFYMQVFGNSLRGTTARYPAGMEPDKEGTLMFSDFTLEGQWFAAMDSAHKHEFNFTEAVSLIVKCESQEEIDRLWEKLSAVSEAEQCGWLKDKYGVSWQIVSGEIEEVMGKGTAEQVDRVTQALLPMKKIDAAKLKAAFEEPGK